MSSTTVLLLHGLHQNPRWVSLLANRLTKAGFSVNMFHYYSTKDDIATHSHRLHQHLLATHNPKVPLHIVAHSLGGLVARHFLVNYPSWQQDKMRMVTLGTPHLGSLCAKISHHVMPYFVGRAYVNALDGNCPIPDHIEIGIIAGNRPFGIGLPILQINSKLNQLDQSHKQNDGTVYVFETLLPSAKDHIILPVTHTGLLYDKLVAQKTIKFLHNGKF